MKARIRFYKITQCGYYEHSNFHFGNISEVLDNLKSWIAGKALNETQTYSVDPENNESNLLRTFCYSIDSKSGEYLITTWNENADVGGKIASIDSLGITGSATIETAEISEGFIPGYPSFFWFIPSKNIFATIQFNTRLNGRKNLDVYLNEFLSTRAKYVIYDEENGENKIVGYGESEENCFHLTPKFNSTLYKQPGEIEFIKQNRESIRKFIKKDKLKLERTETTNRWQTVYRFFTGQTPATSCSIEPKVSIELEMTPSENELENIISQWQSDIESYPIGDVGFTLVGHPQPYWLRQSIASDEFELDVHYSGQEILVPSDKLLEELQRRRNSILAIVHN